METTVGQDLRGISLIPRFEELGGAHGCTCSINKYFWLFLSEIEILFKF